MDEQTRSLLLQVAGYLRLVEKGIAVRREATDLIEKIGRAIAESDSKR